MRIADGFLWHRHIGRGLEFEIAARGNLLFLRDHQRIKAWNLDGVVALLMFSETKNVSHVLRTRTVEEELVLAGHYRAELNGRRRFQTGMRGHSELSTNLSRHARVTAVHRVNAVCGQGGLGIYQRIGIKQGHKEIAICRRHRLKFLGVRSELAVVHGGIRQTTAQLLMTQGRQHHKTNRTAGRLPNRGLERAHVLTELFRLIFK